MSVWMSVLKADPIPWLLEDDNPGVRRLTLTSLLDKPESDPEVKEAGAAIMRRGAVAKILAKQKAGGWWERPEQYYTAKYKGTVWQLILLAELGADGGDPRIRKACEFILETAQDAGSGGFSHQPRAKGGGGTPGTVIPCLTGNMVWSLIKLGFGDDPRMAKGIDWIVKYQRFDDGIAKAPQGPPYSSWPQCFGKHSCHMGVVKALKALAAVPPARRTPAIEKTIDRAVEYLLIHHIHKKSHDLESVSKPGWLRLGFPWMYQTDILEILGILTSLGCRDSRMAEALDKLVSKQGPDGRWILENTFSGRFHSNIERKGAPSKWVTVYALGVLKRFAG